MSRLVLLLHAHLPFVRHVERAGTLEEDWLYEAITDVYLPLCRLFEGWHRDAVPVRLTMSFSPTLVAMLTDELLMARYGDRLRRLISFSRHEDGPLAKMYRERLEQSATDLERYGRDLTKAFRSFAERGQLEIATSAATHAYLPLLSPEPSFLRAQVRIGTRAHAAAFGAEPRGFWLPECGYEPGMDDVLADAGIGWVVTDTHGATNADPPPARAHRAPLLTKSGLLAFPRDPASTTSVWSDRTGYPADPRYRERYRDAGFDRDASTLDGLLLDDGKRRALGFKYHRVTGVDVPLADKTPYDRIAAMDAVEAHADDFVAARLGDDGVLVAPYDAELFGHWWFEGPEFLNRVVRKIPDTDLELVTPSDVIDSGERFVVAAPAASSWGNGGHAETWLNEETDWIWPRLHDAAGRLRRVVAAKPETTGVVRRALTQAGRELLLASASDWPFIVSNGTVVEYATRRVLEHLERFDDLLMAVEANRIDLERLVRYESENNAFAFLEPADFAAE